MRGVKIAIALLLAVAALALGACGGDDGDDEAGGGVTTAPAATAPAETGGGETAEGDADGAEVFASAGCGNCHTLEAAGATGSVGPNLDELQPGEDEAAEQVRNGGGGMPAFEGQLSDAEIDAVAQYVASSTAG
jgi:mono/diheme cytochrome c family protein